MKLKAALFCLAGLLSTNAYGLFMVQLVGGANSTSFPVSLTSPPAGETEDVSGSSGTGYEYGLLVEVGDMFSVQTGVLQIQRSATITKNINIPAIPKSGMATIKYTLNSLQIPLMLRFTPISFISFGAGGVYNMGQGSVGQDVNDPNGVTNLTNGSNSYDAAQISKRDGALAADVQIRIPIAPFSHFMLGVQYQYGLTNVDTSGTEDEKINVLAYMAGFGFGF